MAEKVAWRLCTECDCLPSIVACDGVQVTVDLADGQVKVGDVFDVLKQDKEYIDPDTGRSRGHPVKKIGRVKIVEVGAQFSTALAISEGEGGAKLDLKGLGKFEPGVYRLRPAGHEEPHLKP